MRLKIKSGFKKIVNLTPLHFFLLYVLLISSSGATTSNQNIQIQADHMQISTKNTIIYMGHVVIRKENTQLEGQKIIVQRDGNDQITCIIDYGNPAHYSDQEIDSKQKSVFAHAKIIEFYPKKHLAILKENAFVQQGVDTINAPAIRYDTKNGLLYASGNQKMQMHMSVVTSPSEHS